MAEQTLERPSQADNDTSTSPRIPSEAARSLDLRDKGTAVNASVSNEPAGWGEQAEAGDFDYVPVSPWAPIALCMGLLGLTGFIGYFGLYVAFFGIFVGIGGILQIRSAGGFVKGTSMAAFGLVLSISSFGLGSAKMYYNFQHEVPEGYLRVNFPKDVAEKEFIYIGGHRKLHPDVAAVVGKKVYLKGFMWATQSTEGLSQFILLKDNGECCFGGKPKAHDYIVVKLPSLKSPADRPELSKRASGMSVVEQQQPVADLKRAADEAKTVDDEKPKNEYQLVTRAFIGMVAVAGVLEADVRAGEGKAQDDFEYAAVYRINDAQLVEEAWTRF